MSVASIAWIIDSGCAVDRHVDYLVIWLDDHKQAALHTMYEYSQAVYHLTHGHRFVDHSLFWHKGRLAGMPELHRLIKTQAASR